MRAFEFQREAGSRMFGGGGNGVIYPDGTVDGVQFVTTAPFIVRRANLQGEVGLGRAIHAHGQCCRLIQLIVISGALTDGYRNHCSTSSVVGMACDVD